MSMKKELKKVQVLVLILIITHAAWLYIVYEYILEKEYYGIPIVLSSIVGIGILLYIQAIIDKDNIDKRKSRKLRNSIGLYGDLVNFTHLYIQSGILFSLIPFWVSTMIYFYIYFKIEKNINNKKINNESE